MRTVTITVTDPSAMRYRTVGDWQVSGDHLSIQIADSGDARYNLLVALHELIEVMLCHRDGVTTEMVDQYDLAHQDDDDPGLNPDAPYHDQHMIAFAIEILCAKALGVDWRAYTLALDATYARTPEQPGR